MKRDSWGGWWFPSRRMRSVIVHVGGDSTEGCRQSVCPRALMAPAPELPSRDRALVARRGTGTAQSLATKVRAEVQRRSWAQRNAGASEIRGITGGPCSGQVPLNTESHGIGVKKKWSRVVK